MNKKYLILCAVLPVIAACGGKGQQTRTRAMPVVVKVLPASDRTSQVSTSFVGTVSSSRTATLSAPVSGTLVRLSVREGERVTEGQVLAEVRSQSVQSAYDGAKSRLDQAEDGWTRIQQVYVDGAVTEVDYVKVRTQVEEARAAEKAARKTLEDCCVKAPFSGYVEKTFQTEGVEVTLADNLLRMIDLSALEVHFPLPENEFGQYAQGAKATVYVPALDRSFSGLLQSKGVVASSMSHSYDCTAVLTEPAAGLMPGMVCKVYLESGGLQGCTVPPVSVKTDMQGRYVWVVNDGVVAKRYVTVGGFNGSGIVITDGLQENDKVIVEGARKVSVGMQVQTEE